MAIDATFERIESVKPHPDPETTKLEIAKVSGYDVVVAKGEFKAGDPVFYIRDDAKLVEYDNLKEWTRASDELNLAHQNGDIDEKTYADRREKLGETYAYKYPWQEPLIKYLGGGGRVKTIRLRGAYSSGICIPVDKVFGHISREDARNWEKDNVILTSEFPGNFLLGKYGVCHWEAPIGNVGELNCRGTLPYGIPKSDEENFENLREEYIPYGEKVLITKKLDGTSTTIIALPDGNVHVCTRSNDLMLSADNVWNRAAKPVIPLAQAWAKHYGRTLVLRGETCAPTMQRFSFNKDKDVPVPTFYCYGIIMLDEKDYANHYGLYGTDYHFLKIAEQIKELTGFELKTVPVLGEAILTKELLQEYKNKPLEFGEGIVINTRSNHFKCKSLAYLAALSKKC